MEIDVDKWVKETHLDLCNGGVVKTASSTLSVDRNSRAIMAYIGALEESLELFLKVFLQTGMAIDIKPFVPVTTGAGRQLPLAERTMICL